ncbi:hypothetical protein FQN54_008567 [Arachnomyces sp. PD_36]|nr:hypothetical protein FQN54_008567 [Arachnomyces sp. PD_36]
MVNGTAAVLEPTYRGYVASTQDALILFEACLTGVLHHVPRRPHDRERSHLVQSGSVFIYEENASGIKRWTDGVTWSPSRILGNFLVYRELDKPFPPGEKKRAMKKGNRRPQQTTRPGEPYPRQDSNGPQGYSPTTAAPPSGGFADRGPQSEVERALVGSLVDSYGFKDSGLVKKTMSVTVSGVTHHLVSYYSVEDVMRGVLSPPSLVESLRYIRPRPELISKQSFRAPIDDLDGSMEDHGDPSQALYGYRPSIMGGQGYPMANPAPGYYPMPGAPYASHAPQPGAIPGYPVGGPMSAGHSGTNPYLSNPAAPSQVTPKQEDFGSFRPAQYGPGFDAMNQNIGQGAMSGAMAPSINTPVNQMDSRTRPQPGNSPILYRTPSMQQSRNAPPEATSPVDPATSSNPAYSRSSFSLPGAQDGAQNQPLEPRNVPQPQGQQPQFDPTGGSRRDSNTVMTPGGYYPGGDRTQPPPQQQPQQPQQQQNAPPPAQQQQQRQPPPQFYMGAGAPPGQHSAHYPAGGHQPLGTWNGATPGQAQI